MSPERVGWITIFGTSALSKGAVGWDWFGLQLDDGTALMFGRLRASEGGKIGVFEGTISYADGRQISIQPDDFSVIATGSWKSPQTGIAYPSGWHATFPSLRIELRINPLIPNQELSRGFTYWEGAVSVEGTISGAPAHGARLCRIDGIQTIATCMHRHRAEFVR